MKDHFPNPPESQPNTQLPTQSPTHPLIQPQPRPAPARQPNDQRPGSQISSGRPPRLPGWRLWLPLLFQTGLILGVPAQDAYTYATGRQITLQTAPVDPYDLLRGHYQTLGYDISRSEQLKSLPGGDWFAQRQNQTGQFYLLLEAPPEQQNAPPKPWKPVRVSAEPLDPAANQVMIQGKINSYDQISYGIETYYMPESQRQQLNQDISQTHQQAFVVDVKVDKTGNAVPVRLWVNDHAYQF